MGIVKIFLFIDLILLALLQLVLYVQNLFSFSAFKHSLFESQLEDYANDGQKVFY